MFCRNCGNELRDGAKFCNSCGNAVQSTVVTAPEKHIIADEAKTPQTQNPVSVSSPVSSPSAPTQGVPEEPVARQEWIDTMAKSVATQAVDESINKANKNEVVDRVYFFHRRVFSYIKKTTTVVFQEKDLQLGAIIPKLIPYQSIQRIQVRDKINWGEVYYMAAVAFIGIMCLIAEEVLFGLIMFVLAAIAIPFLKNTAVTVISQSGTQKIVMRKSEENKDMFLQDLQLMTGCRVERQ